MSKLDRELHPTGARILFKWNARAPIKEGVIVEWSRGGNAKLSTVGAPPGWLCEAEFPDVVELLDVPSGDR
jgi:hypothetical protein